MPPSCDTPHPSRRNRGADSSTVLPMTADGPPRPPDPQPIPPPVLPDAVELSDREKLLLRRLANHYYVEPRTYAGMGPQATELHAYEHLKWRKVRDVLVDELGASLVERLTIEYRIYLDPSF